MPAKTLLPLKKGLNSNLIKILALLFMTIDHVGVVIFPHLEILRIIGRLSFPLFAFTVAEGCYYTRNKLLRFLMIFLIGASCQLVFYLYSGELLQNILLTFSLSMAMIYAYQYFLNKKNVFSILLFLASIVFVYFMTNILPNIIPKRGFRFDYGFSGAVLPLLIYLFRDARLKFVATAVGVLLLALSLGDTQWYGLLALIILAFYDGTKGKLKIKYLFYVYYPLHLLVIYGISMLMGLKFF